MATVNHSRISNIQAQATTNETTNWVWAITRGMKKAGWKFHASSDGATKVSDSDPAADLWGAGVVTNVGAGAASITTIANGRATVTGLTGIVAADKGRFILFSGAATGASNNQHQIEEVIDGTSVRVDARNFAIGASDANNGAITWSILDPTSEVFPTGLNTSNIWWTAQGPSILRIPFTVAASGLFIRGENLVQTSTGAEGELLGYTFDAGAGYLVVAPRLRGSGSGVHGWDTANLITGAISGATLTQNGTALEYAYEIVLAKNTSNSVQLFVGQFETVAENAERFSFCATQAGCTPTVPPGAGGTGNAFGAHAWVAWGNSTSPGAGTSLITASASVGNVICADAIPEEDYSADGSWLLAYAFISSGNPTGFEMFGFQRVDDTEDGDLAPYVSVNLGGLKTLYAGNRLSAGTFGGSAPSLGNVAPSGTTRVGYAGWRRRGLSNESFAELEPSIMQAVQSNASFSSINAPQITRVVTSPNESLRVREPVWMISAQFGAKMIKGTLRWIYYFPGEQATTILGTVDPAWVQLTNSVPGCIVGPASLEPWILNR